MIGHTHNYNQFNGDLLLSDLHDANVARLPHFKNALGLPAHDQPDGSDWSLGEWMCALAGEVGEAANFIKKMKRGDLTTEEGTALLAKELADVQCYLSLLAYRANIDLAKATISKFNEVSKRIGSPVRL
jgi:NTP pyrophosphatase (non-canonical NTP hydrolase)